MVVTAPAKQPLELGVDRPPAWGARGVCGEHLPPMQGRPFCFLQTLTQMLASLVRGLRHAVPVPVAHGRRQSCIDACSAWGGLRGRGLLLLRLLLLAILWTLGAASAVMKTRLLVAKPAIGVWRASQSGHAATGAWNQGPLHGATKRGGNGWMSSGFVPPCLPLKGKGRVLLKMKCLRRRLALQWKTHGT